ncbi:MAG TPA: hypothetical protein VJM14_09140 [Burkholderiales bacterium]|nr:hypothetical protein [Burkholderiales bacterium]
MKTLLSLSRLMTLLGWTGPAMSDSFWPGRVAVALLVLSGCAYLEEPKATDHTSVVKAGRWGEIYRGGYVELVSVNGVEPRWRLRSDIEVPPGDQTGLFYVFLCSGGSMPCNNSIAGAQVSFRAEAGHTYRAHAREQVNGSNRFWIWVEDDATGKVVGGTAPPGSP